MSNLYILERQVRGVMIVDLEGNVTIGETNQQLHEAIKRLVAEGKKSIILNLAKVTLVDSSGLGEMVAGYSTLKASGGSLKLINLPERVVDLMTITKLYTVFDIYNSEAEGIDGFEKEVDLATQPLDEKFATRARAGSSLL